MEHVKAMKSDSETDTDTTMEPKGEKGVKEEKEGWSFEADDIDVNRLIDEVVGQQQQQISEESELLLQPAEVEIPATTSATAEKTPLEDVFKFDSELATIETKTASDEDDDEGVAVLQRPLKQPVAKALSLDDLNDALAETTTDDEEGGHTGASASAAVTDDEESSSTKKTVKMSTSLNVTFDEDSLISAGQAREKAAVVAAGGSAVDSSGGGGSSVGSSPNPKSSGGGGKKGKKKKKKRGF